MNPFTSALKLSLPLLLIPLSFPLPASALLGGITANGGWTETIDASDLAAGAGSNLISTYTSGSGATLINVSATLDLLGWTVSVQRSDVNWLPSFHLYAKRTGSGSGCSVNNGTTYQEVTTSGQSFFACPALLNNGVSNVPVQYQLTGVSVAVPAGTYSTTIIYTVTGGGL